MGYGFADSLHLIGSFALKVINVEISARIPGYIFRNYTMSTPQKMKEQTKPNEGTQLGYNLFCASV